MLPKSGGKWWAQSVSDLIHNPVYRGQRCEFDRVTKRYGRLIHEVEPLVDAGLWKRANDNLSARPKRGTIYAANRAQLAGALDCPVCEDSPMNRIVTGKPGNQNVYYRCTGRGANRKSCGLMVSVSAVDEAVDQVLMGLTFPEQVLVPPDIPDHSADLARLSFDEQQVSMSGLSRADKSSQLTKIWDAIDEIESLIVEETAAAPAEPKWVDTDAGTYADIWQGLPVAERGAWLNTKGFTVTASKTVVAVTQPGGKGAPTKFVRI